MYRLVLAVMLFFISFKTIQAQQWDDFPQVDAATYRLYLEQKWDSLRFVADAAIKNNIDYYYLRMRAGIACYELERYHAASKHFEAALDFNTIDVLAMEYLYYSYLFSGRKEEAVLLSRKKMSDALKEKLKLDRYKLIEEVHIEGGPTLGNNPYMKRENQGANPNVLLFESELTNDVWYFSVGLKHQLTKRINIFHAASSIDIGKTQILDVYNGIVSNDYRIYQRQYYINAGIYLGKGFTFTPAFHIINVNFDKLAYTFDDDDKLFLEQFNYAPTEYVIAASLKKHTGLFDIALNGSYAKLNNHAFSQVGATFTVFPWGNLNYYFSVPLVYQQNLTKKNIIIDPLVGLRLHDKLWVEGNYTFGHINNYVEKNAYVVYNINDNILSRKGLSLLINVNKNIQFRLMYQHTEKENSRSAFLKNKDTRIINTNNFINHTIIGGIKWTL